MTETLSVRIDSETKRRLEALSVSMNRSKSFLAAEAISTYVAAEEWQLGEIRAGMNDLENGRSVSHDKVAKWMATWGTKGETKPPL